MARFLPIASVSAFGIMVITACGSAEPQARPSRLADSADAVADGADGGTDGAGQDGTTTGAGDDGEAGGAAGEDAFEEAGGDGGETLDDILAQCGDVNFDHPEQELLNVAFTGLPLIKKGSQAILGIPINYEVTIQPALTIKATLEKSVTTTQLTVASAKPALAMSQAEKQVAEQNGATTTELLPVADRSDLASAAAAWEGVVCTAQPGTKITTTLGGKSVVTSFNPPVPASVSPKADAARYAKELGASKSFTNIVATVESSDNPAVKPGQTYTGTVTISPIASTFETTLSNGQKAKIGGDLAYEVKVDFGSVAITNALGLKPVTRFYIDTKNHVYKVILADIGDPATPPAIFLK